jgi:carbonic anhydrase/acetyltransferase-like protein (isoleucine patch superfamily)
MIIEYKGITPIVGANVFIAPTAAVIGDVEIKDNASIWYGAVLRGDTAPVTIGRNTNIQDNCTVHTDAGCPAVIGDNVTVGHNAVVHGCIVENDCLIGIGAVILSGAKVKKGSIVAAGSVVIEEQQIDPYHLATGSPAKMKKKLPKNPSGDLPQTVKNYLNLSAVYKQAGLGNS